jgi:hypothetical protein
MESIMKNIKFYFQVFLWSMIVAVTFTSCEDPYFPEITASDDIVVEGYIEGGEDANPTYVILTKSIPFLSDVKVDQFNTLFVKGASVTVIHKNKEVPLTELCINDLPPAFRDQVYAVLGFDPDSVQIDICVYADLLDQIDRKRGDTYDLRVKVGDKTLTATTTIPQFVPINEHRFTAPPGEPNDTLAQLFIKVADPLDKNYYRYFTATEGNGLIPPFNSVTDDAIFDGKNFEFPLQKAERRNFNRETFGYFKRGDTISIKWCLIDKPHFDFWNTRDFSNNSGGPFASYTRISTNVKGGLGIWGGYATETYTWIVPK